MGRCSEDDFLVCDMWAAPRTLTAVAFPPDVTYLRVEQCVVLTVSENDEAGEEDDEENGDEAWECLDNPLPMEYYGATAYYASTTTDDRSVSLSHWPSSVDVDYSSAVLCEKVLMQNYRTVYLILHTVTYWYY